MRVTYIVEQTLNLTYLTLQLFRVLFVFWIRLDDKLVQNSPQHKLLDHFLLAMHITSSLNFFFLADAMLTFLQGPRTAGRRSVATTTR